MAASATRQGVLLVAATPIGNPADASPRLAAALADADVLAVEDTRRLRRLCADLGVKPTGRLVSLFEGNEAGRVGDLVAAVRDGAMVLLVTDAGTPLVSDPGYRVVAACAGDGLAVSVLPGPSAVLAALVVSGLPTDRFCVEGFLPRKAGERDRRLAELAGDARTLVLFESPRRTAATLQALAAAFGADRPAAVCRELTKTYEEVRRGPLGELAGWAGSGVLGEVTIVVGGRTAVASPWAAADLVALVAERERAGLSRKDAIADAAREAGLPKREVYAAVVGAPGRP
ncbi:MAG: 16S rRNA (cytidine(1402)-2'-O)-methyltransferase [Acidimicrobiales bacterium]|nr:16S rRNA (cytidine(1402)-2'-O)-methyltransferase [Acidimicrobiales bacterium]